MTFFEVIVLGVVQGLTEFLPVSSSGHLVAARVFFGISDTDGNALDAFLHLGTLCAVLVYFWRVWLGIGRAVFVRDEEARDKRELMAKLAVATVPAAIIGYAAQGAMLGVFRSPAFVAAGLLVTAVLLYFSDRLSRRRLTIARAGFVDALWIGVAQVAALIPGISRSGMTMAAGLMRGLSRTQAATFSFLLSAPIIAGAGLSSLGDLWAAETFSWGLLLAGLLVSFVVGLSAIYLLLHLVRRMSFLPFVVYLTGLAVVLLVLP